MNFRIVPVLALVSITACPETTTVLNPDYCGHHGGDAYCGRETPETPYCVLSSESCYDQYGLDVAGLGCVAEVPVLECRQECGIDNGDGCLETVGEESSSSGGETEDPSTTTETDTDTEDPSTTTGPECSETVPCVDEAAPFCVEGECSPCSAVVDGTPDEACAALDEATPLCVDDACVQCTAESFDACGGTTPLCGDDNTCVGCSFHEECQDIGLHACNIATGACFSADAADVSEVNLAGANALQNAVNEVANGAEHTIIVTGSTSSTHSAVIDGGKTIAIVSTDANIQTVRGAGGSPTLSVNGAGSTVYLHRLRIEDSNDVGISVGTAGTLYADSTQVSGNDGGGITLAAGSFGFLRNSMVGVGLNEVPAILVSGGTLEALYTSILGGAFDSYGLRCTSGSATVRNSIVTTRGDNDALVCPGASTPNTAVENTGDPNWFTNYNAGDAHLTAAGQVEFANVATWEDGDPPFDFERDDRPATDGAMDYPGADTVP